MTKSATLRLALLLLVAGGIAAAFCFLPVQEHLQQFLTWVREQGVWGAVMLVAVYIIATVLCVPGSLLTLGAGFAFGLVLGIIIISIASTLGAAAAFLVGRTVARGWVERRIASNPRFRAIDQAVAEHGFKIVLLTRLSPVFPYNLLNYAFSLTKVSFRDYFLASWIGMLPGTVLFVYLGTIVRDLADLAAGRYEKGVAYYVLLGVGLAATLLVTVYVARLARVALARAAPEAVAELPPQADARQPS